MQLRVGSRWRSAVDDTQVVVVRAPEGEVSLTCGGHPLIPGDSEPAPGLTISGGNTGGTALAKRYADPGTGLELLCVKAGTAALALNGAALPLKSARTLPTSD